MATKDYKDVDLSEPEDRKLRLAEKDVLIGKMRRDLAYEICDPVVQVFLQCAEAGPFRMIFLRRCSAESKVMRECLVKEFHSRENKNKVTEEYLRLRQLYRTTGLSIPMRKALDRQGKLEPILEEFRKSKFQNKMKEETGRKEREKLEESE